MGNSNRKLSRELSLFILILAVPIFVLSLGVLFLQSRYLIHQEVSECTNSLLNTALHRIRYYMSTIETAANSNVWMLEENFRPDSLKSVSNRIVRLNGNVTSSSFFAVPETFKGEDRQFSIYTENQGDTVVTYFEPEYDYLGKVCYTRPLSSGNACWVDPFKEYSEGKVDHNEAVATYCQPVRQKNGRIMGVLTADFAFSQMGKMLNEVEHPYEHAYYILLGGDGRYLMHPDTTRLFRKTIFTDADPSKDKDLITLGHEMTAGKQGTIHISLDREKYHVCYRPVPGTDWSLALVCPDGDAMMSYYNLGYVIIALIVGGLFLILILCHRVVKQTIRPIDTLIDTTQKMADRQYDETIPVSTQHDLISLLQNSFAQMQQSLSERMNNLRQKADEIRQQNAELDQTRLRAEDTVRKKTLFMQHMVPQMRMPLNVVMGFADVLIESSTDKSMVNEDELNSITGMMKTNVIKMNRIVLMMLDASETDATETYAGKRTDEVSCNEISRECIEYAQKHFSQENIQFKTELQDGYFILTNKNFLMGILRELLHNAVKYSDGKHIMLRVTQTDASVRFIVQDVGPGLPAEVPDLVYKHFTLKDELPEGVGLGLPLARRYANNLQGQLVVDTAYKEGCRIVIEMPK